MEWWQVLLLMFVGLVAVMATGMPIAFAFGVLNVVMLFLFVGGIGPLQAVALSSFSSVATFAFSALPMFLLMGTVVMYSGLATLAIEAIGKWLGKIPGRLAVLSVIAGTVLGGASGSSMADTATLGMVLIPEMRRRGYSKYLATGCIAICGALDVLIPPSALMVIMGAISRLSVGDLLIGGLVPGLLLSALTFLYIVIVTTLKPHLAPPYDVGRISWRERFAALGNVLPLVVLILVVLGAMFAGVATPTEAAAVGALGAFGLAFAYGRLTRSVVKESLLSTVEVTGLALLIITSSTAFSQILAHTGAAAGLSRWATGLAVSPWLVLVGMQIVILIMGCFMDSVSIMLITVPLFFPVVSAMGFDLMWFAIVTVVNIELGLITPPFGMDLFVLKGVCPPDITLGDIYRGILPFIVINILALAIVMIFPPLATWLPGLMH